MTDGPGAAWLFCPADRPDRYAKAMSFADTVILDLEDGVAARDRARARAELVANPLDPERTVVRINPAGTADHDEDLSTLQRTDYRRLMLAKAESAEQVAALAGFTVVALCETPAGVHRAAEIAAAEPVVALMWGAEDLVAAIGGTSSRFPDGRYRQVAVHARNTILLAAAANGIAAVDAVYLAIADVDGLRRESEDAAASGFGFKACIHPSQVPVVRAAYAPSPEQVGWAMQVLAAARDQPGVFALDGTMIDEPVLRQARRTLSRARPAAGSSLGNEP